jgi:hypothetical protein
VPFNEMEGPRRRRSTWTATTTDDACHNWRDDVFFNWFRHRPAQGGLLRAKTFSLLSSIFWVFPGFRKPKLSF